MDIEWMVIRESLGLEEAKRRRRAKVDQMLGVTEKSEPDPDGRTSVIGSWLARALTTLVGRRPRRSTIQVAPQT